MSNAAFVFVKPHANTDATRALVKETLAAKGITIVSEGTITSEDIDSKKYIDQHYYAIASKATILKPAQLNIPTDKFKEKFGLEWAEALSQVRLQPWCQSPKSHGRDRTGPFGADVAGPTKGHVSERKRLAAPLTVCVPGSRAARA